MISTITQTNNSLRQWLIADNEKIGCDKFWSIVIRLGYYECYSNFCLNILYNDVIIIVVSVIICSRSKIKLLDTENLNLDVQ